MDYNIVIVEDNADDAALLRDFLARYGSENGTDFAVRTFDNGVDFLSDYTCDADIIFLDIQMPYLNGVNVAKRLRGSDNSAVVIFYSNMVQYAIDGYSLEVFDFLVKTPSYPEFAKKMQRALRRADANSDKYILIRESDAVVRAAVGDVYLVEKERNYLVYRTRGRDYRERNNLGAVEKELESLGFAKCRSGCMVNLRHVTGYNNSSVFVGGSEIPISRGESKSFTEKLVAYFNGTKSGQRG